MLDHTQAAVAVAVGAVTILSALVGWLRWVRPWWRGFRQDYVAGRDALVGRDAVVDSITGRELAPALPGIGQRMANVETALVELANQRADIDALKDITADHGLAIAELKAAAVERIVTRQDSAQAWRAIEKAIDAIPPEDQTSGD